MAEGLQPSGRDLVAALPSPLACFALSGGHRTLFSVIALGSQAITEEPVSRGASEDRQ